MTTLLGILLLLLAGFQGTPGPAPQAAADQRIECPTCAGSGIARQDCLECKGAKSFACGRCDGDDMLEQMIATAKQLLRVFPGQPKLINLIDTLQAGLKASKLALEHSFASPEPKDPSRKLACPAACVRGSVGKAKLECKVCRGKGWVDCPDCDKKGRVDCGVCTGRGTVQRDCESCNGTKTILRPPYPGNLDACGWCLGKGSRSCVRCNATGVGSWHCRLCNGKGIATCKKCLGARKSRCAKCSGSGSIPTISSSRLAPCPICAKSGLVPCTTCDAQGKQACETCNGGKGEPAGCRSCLMHYVAVCPGCVDGAHRSWELSAEVLASLGQRDGALSYWGFAQNRMEEQFNTFLQVAKEPAERLRLEKLRAVERRRFQARAEEWKP